MTVKINIQKNLQYLTRDRAMVEVEGSTVGQCLDQLIKIFPDLRTMASAGNKTWLDYVSIFVNKESAYPNELATPVKDGDEIDIILIFAGG
ncbi:MAG: MoaD/ThiS family protein [Deltaproteobacteria bacterium]|nr:MoaD/ThiS family protein [Deltaproteobacteria bacterium]